MKSLKYFGKLKKPKLPLIRRVVGDSMLPTLRPGQIVVGVPYNDKPRVGEIVIVRHGGLEKIKRIDRISDSRLYVIGDNQARSTDSRSFGWLHYSALVARVVWPHRP